jgi:hypothetical protein
MTAPRYSEAEVLISTSAVVAVVLAGEAEFSWIKCEVFEAANMS